MPNRRTSIPIAAAAASLALALTCANGQSPNAPSGNAAADANRPSANDTYRADHKAAKDADEAWQRTHRASKIIGTEVLNPQGQKIGKVKDLVLQDPQSGRISQVVIAVGGVAGMGDKLFAVPYEQLQMATDQKHVVLNGSNDLAQTFDEKHWPELADRSASNGDRANSAASAPAPSTTANSAPPRDNASSSAPSSPSNASGSTAKSSTE